jgi:hypothetical protein
MNEGCCFQKCEVRAVAALAGKSPGDGLIQSATYCRDHLWYMWGYFVAKEWTDIREVPLSKRSDE